MSFPLLLQQQGVQLRSWQYRIPSAQLVCRTCLFARRPFHLQHTTPPLLGTDASLGLRRRIASQYRWQRSHAPFLPALGSRQVHLTATKKDPRVEELITLLARSPYISSSGTSSLSSTHSIKRREYRKRLSTLYESIRRDTTAWNQLEDRKLMALYAAMRPSINDPTFQALFTNAQHVLQDIQQHKPSHFGLVHMEALLSTYKAKGQAEQAVDLMKWTQARSLAPTVMAYECLIATLTMTPTTPTTWARRGETPMGLALHYWNEMQGIDNDTTTLATRQQTVGYIMQGYLAQGDLLKAASWLTTHTDPENEKMKQVLDHWKSASLGDPHSYAIGVVSYGLEILIQQAARNDRYLDARQFYRQQCELYNYNNRAPALAPASALASASTPAASQQRQQSTVGLIRLMDRYMETNQSKALHRLLDDALDMGHEKGVRIIANRLLNYYSTKNRLRHAIDLYYHLDSLPSNTTTMADTVYDMAKIRALLLQAAKSKYHVDVFRLYQRFITLYPSKLDIRAYTHILQMLVRTKKYDQARLVYQDILAQATPLLVVDSRKGGDLESMTEHTKRFLHLVYSLCAQTGDLALFQSVVTLQRRLGLPVLHHHSLTSLMATYVKTGDTSSAKTVFDYLAHRRVPQQQQQQQQQRSSSPVESWTRPGDDDLDDVEQSDVDVVDFNLLMRTVGQEEQHKVQHGNGSNVPNQILDILRHMALVGVTSNATTLRTLLDIYPSDDIKMEDQLFMTLRNDPQATHHDRIWLNNLKLTRFLLDNNDKDGRGSLKAATIFLSNDRSSLFPECVDEPIEADGMTYKLLLDALTRHKRHAAMAQRVFDHMRSRGWRPTMVVYEQLMVVWAKRQQVEKVKAVIDVACQDLGWSQVPAKWYTSALDALVNQSSPHVHAWILEIKKQKAVLADPVLADRLVKYGLSPSPPMNKHKQQHCHS
ncbi:hypothetical protein [Absidia glauca]|uniref:Pentacotripeptide-repeat region of PRORP domain-containing protein n=1 Tax=Absidia glauca TaxID=4829 RepID=A0A168QA33_ABSGL|nr:hypothetical protein [Absidia glauca]